MKKPAQKSKPIKLAMSKSTVRRGHSRRHHPWWSRPDESRDLARRLNADSNQRGLRSVSPEYLTSLQKVRAAGGIDPIIPITGSFTPQKRKTLSAKSMKKNEQDHTCVWIAHPYQVVVYQSKGKGRGKRPKFITKYNWRLERVFH